MSDKKVSIEGLKQLYQAAAQKKNYLKSISQSSLFEYRSINFVQNSQHLLAFIIQVLQNNIDGPILKSILTKPQQFYNSLLGYCFKNQELFINESYITVSHQQAYSQSLLLALFLGKQCNTKIDFVVFEKSLKGVGHLIAEQTEADRLGFTKSSAQKEGIIIHNIEDWQPQTWINQNSVIVLDVFGLHPIIYRPFLLKYFSQIKKAKKVILYHSHLQDQQILNQFQSIKAQVGEWLPLQLWLENPLQTIVQDDQKSILQRLFSFLKQEMIHPQKNDAAIFIPANIHVKRFASKFSEMLSKHQLKDKVNIILKPHQSQPLTKNNIFLVQSTFQLADWDYDYSHLFYVIDYQTESNYFYDYNLSASVHSIRRCSGVEKAKRMSVVSSNRIGRYVCLSTELGQNLHYIQAAPQLSTYIIKMVHLGLGKYLQKQQKRMQQCLNQLLSFEIIEFSQGQYKIKASPILKAVKNQISCIQAKHVLDILQNNQLETEQKNRLANLMIALFQVLQSNQSLYKYKVGAQMMTNKRLDSIWRTSGYIQSCLQVITKCENIDLQIAKLTGQPTQAQNFKRLSSKISEEEDQNSLFGCLFQLCDVADDHKDIMSVPAFLRIHLVNQQIFYDIRQRIEYFRQVLGILPCQIIFQREDLSKLFKILLKKIPEAIATYTGYKRRGYIYEKQNINAQLSQESLYAKSKQHPQYLFVCGLEKVQNQYKIMYSNTVSSEQLFEIYGSLPIRKLQSLGEVQLQFHGIPSSTFEQLLRKNEQTLIDFENQYNCLVQPNQELGICIVHSEKAKSSEIKTAFENLLKRTKERISNVRKTINYLGRTNILMGPGGQIQDLTKSKQIINKCLVSNLHLDVTKGDLQEIFQQFFHLRGLVVNEPQPKSDRKTAFVKFYSQKDYENFYECFDNCLYFGLHMKVSPIKSQEKRQSKIVPRKYIQFKWYVWQSHGKAYVRFISAAAALKAEQSLLKNPKFDQVDIVVSRKQNSIFLENLRSQTDQIYIQQAMKGFGQVLQVEVMKSPIRQATNPDNQIQKLIRKVEGFNQNIHYDFQPVQRKANGLRLCRVHFDYYEHAQFPDSVITTYNKKIGILGQSRLYATLFIEKPILVSQRLTSLYLQILQEVISEVPYNPFITTRVCKEKHQQYLILIGNVRNLFENMYNSFLTRVRPTIISLSKNQKNLLFNGLALSNIMYIEQKYRCKLTVDLAQKDVRCISTKKVGKTIQQELKSKIASNFFCILRLNSKAYKHFKSNPKDLENLKQKFHLTTLSLQTDSYSVLINGTVYNVQNAIAHLMHFAQSLVKPQELRINTEVCGICCDPFKRPYRLQRCSHLFCNDCLKGCFQSVLKDASLFPMKCPHCLELLTLTDIQLNLIPNQFQKMKTIAINKYVGLNTQKLRFCYTVGCKQINILDGPTWNCQTCKIKYCNLCKETYHPGLKCQQVVVVRQSDQYFKKYLLQNGGRQCPNPGCKMPVVKIDGCNKVQCTRCMKSMCFKCPPQKMIPYDNPSDCYDHLTKQHGGYY